MKLIIQIPCLNEADTLGDVFRDLPAAIPGIDRIETLVVDDGSCDRTSEVARTLGATHIVRHRHRRGLAAAFATGLTTSLRLGADVIVNLDGDHQYSGQDIPRLVEPLMAGRADLVIGDRRPSEDRRLPCMKRYLHGVGRRVVGFIGGQPVSDPVSGFRAFTRGAAAALPVISRYSYTIETLLRAIAGRLRVEYVVIRTNAATRPSRLIRSLPQFLWHSGLTLLSVGFQLRPLALLMPMILGLSVSGMLLILLAVNTNAGGGRAAGIFALVVGVVAIVAGAGLFGAGLLGEAIVANRRLLEVSIARHRSGTQRGNSPDWPHSADVS